MNDKIEIPFHFKQWGVKQGWTNEQVQQYWEASRQYRDSLDRQFMSSVKSAIDTEYLSVVLYLYKLTIGKSAFDGY